MGSAVQKGGRLRERSGSRSANNSICVGRLIVIGHSAMTFRSSPTMVHVTIAVALVGAAITIGLTIWESQKGKTRGPVIIDHQFVSHRQR